MAENEGQTGTTQGDGKSPDGAMAKAVALGDRRGILTAAMGKLATTLDSAAAQQVAGLVNQLAALSKQIDDMGPPAGTEEVDVLADAVAKKLRGTGGEPDSEAEGAAEGRDGEPGA